MSELFRRPGDNPEPGNEGKGKRQPADNPLPYPTSEDGLTAYREAAVAAFLAEEDPLLIRTHLGRGSTDDADHGEPGPDSAPPAPEASAEKTRPGYPDIHARYPADYKPAPDAPLPAIEGPHESPDVWVDAINSDKSGDGRMLNCGDCSRCVDGTWHGFPAVAAAVNYPQYVGDNPARMAEWAGVDPIHASMAEVRQRLDELGPGSSAIVGCDWKNGKGHWFNGINDGGAVKAVDGQHGLVESWPPTLSGIGFDESQMSYSDAIYFTPDGKVVRHDHR
jgi:hypothetical protein